MNEYLEAEKEASIYKVAVAPRSCGYGDVTVTYIRRSEIPSRIYAKYQYKQESEAEAQW